MPITVCTKPLLSAGFLFALSLLAACTGAKFTAPPSAKAFPPFQGEVRVLDSYPAPGSFDRIGVVVVNAPDYVSDARVRARLREEAARRGANAVVLQGPIKSVPYRDGALQRRLAAFAVRLR